MTSENPASDHDALTISGTHRVVTRASHLWIVREADATLSPTAPRGQCLVCESALSVRTAWQYPSDWTRLPDEQLLQLFA